MRSAHYFVALGAVLSSASSAQTVEESYAKLCSGANKGSESCQVLRKALLEKLAGEDRAAAPAPNASKAIGTAPKTAPASAAKWGFFAALPDSGAFHAPSSLLTYSWREKNRVMAVREEIGGVSGTITLRDDGTFEWIWPTATSTMVDMGDGTFLQTAADGKWRVRYSLVEGGMKTVLEFPKDGGWAQLNETVSTRLNPQQLAEARANMQQAGNPENIRANWGVYAQMVGRSWVNKSWELRNVWAYEWVVPGISMSRRYAALSKDKISSPPTPKAAAILFDPVAKTLSGPGKLQADGTLLLDMGNMRTITRMIGADGYEEETEELKNGKWKHLITARYEVAGSADIDATLAALSAPKAKGGGGLLGSIAGAVGGAAAGAAFGGGTEAVLGGAAKGAAMFTPNSGAAAALNVAGDSLIGGNVTSGLGSASSGAKASYPTRPNALSGSSACSMMNESNYRQVGVEGGNDVQLKTMCAQAYEYYVMYKRAIAQGYSEADANRTYDAHQQAAQNAMSFYANNRAD